MDYGNYSMLAMVTAAVIYLLAFFAHAAEWAAARHATGTVQRTRRLSDRAPALVGADAGGTTGSGLGSATADQDATLLVDEAHAVGVRGPRGGGMLAQLGLAGLDHVVVTASLSKALGSQGGAVLGHRLARRAAIRELGAGRALPDAAPERA